MVTAAFIVYGLGVALGLWRGDASPVTRVALALLWPLGPLAFVVTVAVLVGAALIAFPAVAAGVAAAAVATWWWAA